MRPRVAMGVWGVLGMLAWQPALAEKRPVRLLVQDLRVDHVAPKVAQFTTEALTNEIRKLEGVRVFGLHEIQQMLFAEEEKRAVGCTDEVCLTEIAAAMNADQIIVGTLASTRTSSIITLQRLDPARAEPLSSITRQVVAGDGSEFLSVLGDVVAELLPGRVPRLGLERGVRPEVARQLNPPPLPRGLFWTVSSTAAAAGIAGLTLALLFLEAQNDRATLLADSIGGTPAEAAQVAILDARIRDRALAANVLFITAGGLALGAVVTGLFTNWQPTPARLAFGVQLGATQGLTLAGALP